MNNMMKPLLFAIALLSIGMSSCVVSKKKYDQLEAQRKHTLGLLDECRYENDRLKKDLAALNLSADSLRDALGAQSMDNTNQAEEIKRLKSQVSKLREQNTKLSDDFARMEQTHQQLKNQSTKEIRELINKLELMEADLAIRESRLREIESQMREQDSIMQAIRKSIEDALFGFKDAGLSVEVRNGKVYVSLSNKLMFSSGSTQLDNRGKSALKELARVLNQQTDLSILVEGHTDNVPVTNLGALKDNWDLSVLRSTEVVRYLTEKEKVDPKRITASGKGEFMPISSNSSADEKAKNRRTEIILTPKLSELYQLLPPKK
jgi:chemotaxis protein MotB